MCPLFLSVNRFLNLIAIYLTRDLLDSSLESKARVKPFQSDSHIYGRVDERRHSFGA